VDDLAEGPGGGGQKDAKEQEVKEQAKDTPQDIKEGESGDVEVEHDEL
jgi:hypothetical protein